MIIIIIIKLLNEEKKIRIILRIYFSYFTFAIDHDHSKLLRTSKPRQRTKEKKISIYTHAIKEGAESKELDR